MKLKRYQKLRLVVYLLHQWPDGLSETEIAAYINEGRRNVNNWLRDLEEDGQVEAVGSPARWVAREVWS